jgi:DNA-binding transcriptional ArsR family regulator
MSDLLRALAEPRRQAILRLVWHGEREAGEIHRAAGGITFGAVSQHLRVLRDAGAVRTRKDGRRRLYRADHATLRPLRGYLEKMWAQSLGDLKALAEDEERKGR